MIHEIHFPSSLAASELDHYLAKGWYRMGQSIFTSRLMPFNGTIHTLHWLRIFVPNVEYGNTQKKILAKNSEFECVVLPFAITREMDDLFMLYRDSIEFNAPESISSYLQDGTESNIYNTNVIEIRDGGKLIAVGFFDSGETSIAGILNFYHPDYKSKSLGKYLMLLKIEHALQHKIPWYYLGYVARGYSKFDYKLFPDIRATEVFDYATKQWIPFSWPLSAGIADFIDLNLLAERLKELK